MRLTVRRILSNPLFGAWPCGIMDVPAKKGGYYEHPHVGQRCVRMAGL